MDLFMRALDNETEKLHENGVRLRFIGDILAFEPNLRDSMLRATRQTANNTRMTLNVAVNYGGRWDIAEAARKLARAAHQGLIVPDDIDEEMMSRQICLEGNDPDLFIRTGGEMRISNFLLWQSAYTEFYFTTVLWPDFSPEELDKALAVYRSRERRFGLTSEQIREKSA
jgi:undecaprenyl diphosphate synthase